MSIAVLIIGDSGAGKSHSIQFLNHKKTFVVNVSQKDLPWKGSGKQYISVEVDPKGGNLLNSKDPVRIIKTLKYISKNLPHIKNIVVDDNTHIAASYFLNQAAKEEVQIANGERPNIYRKFTNIAQFTVELIDTAKSLRDDLVVFFMHHVDNTSDIDSDITKKAAGFGKFVEEKVKGIESQFTVVLYAGKKREEESDKVVGYFRTTDITSTAKSPVGMFDKDEIPNNLSLVRKYLEEYYNQD